METREIGYIPMLKSDNYPKRFMFLDTETFIEGNPKVEVTFPLKLGCCIYCEIDNDLNVKKRRVYHFTSIPDFLDILLSHTIKKSNLVCFAHNWQFDIRVLNLFDELQQRGFSSEPPIINERLFIWTTKSKKGDLLFLDTANYAVSTVEALGKDMGYSKGKVDFNTVSDVDLALYCQRDTEILEKFVLTYIRFLVDNNLGSFKTSLASQALTSWRTRFMSQSIFIHNHEDALKLERRAYHGGRVECFWIDRLPKQRYYYLDVNSMYPYSMKCFKSPYKPIEHRFETKLAYLQSRIDKYYIIADVELNTDEPVYPYIHKNKLLFPIGKFRTVLHHAELEYAIKHRHIKSIHASVYYKQEYLFSEYVDFFYSVKKNSELSGNKSWRFIAKIFLNSLYGKFGQSKVTRIPLGKDDKTNAWRLPGVNENTGEHYTDFGWYGEVIRELKGGEVAYSAPSVAGCITANARMLLWKYIKQAGTNHVYYCDTDSLIVDSVGFNNLKEYINEHELGMLKLEKCSNNVVINGNKDYRFGNEIRMKGVPSKAEQLDINKWGYLQFQSLLAALKLDITLPPSAKYVTKSRKTRYDKGIITETGKIVPISLSE